MSYTQFKKSMLLFLITSSTFMPVRAEFDILQFAVGCVALIGGGWLIGTATNNWNEQSTIDTAYSKLNQAEQYASITFGSDYNRNEQSAITFMYSVLDRAGMQRTPENIDSLYRSLSQLKSDLVSSKNTLTQKSDAWRLSEDKREKYNQAQDILSKVDRHSGQIERIAQALSSNMNNFKLELNYQSKKNLYQSVVSKKYNTQELLAQAHSFMCDRSSRSSNDFYYISFLDSHLDPAIKSLEASCSMYEINRSWNSYAQAYQLLNDLKESRSRISGSSEYARQVQDKRIYELELQKARAAEEQARAARRQAAAAEEQASAARAQARATEEIASIKRKQQKQQEAFCRLEREINLMYYLGSVPDDVLDLMVQIRALVYIAQERDYNDAKIERLLQELDSAYRRRDLW